MNLVMPELIASQTNNIAIYTSVNSDLFWVFGGNFPKYKQNPIKVLKTARSMPDNVDYLD